MTKKMTHDDSLFFALCENVIESNSLNTFLILLVFVHKVSGSSYRFMLLIWVSFQPFKV